MKPAASTWALGLAALGLAFGLSPAMAQGVIKIGEINSYKAQAAFLGPYLKGMELAVEQINASGGVLGRPLKLVTRDDNANPSDAVRAAEEAFASAIAASTSERISASPICCGMKPMRNLSSACSLSTRSWRPPICSNASTASPPTSGA